MYTRRFAMLVPFVVGTACQQTPPEPPKVTDSSSANTVTVSPEEQQAKTEALIGTAKALFGNHPKVATSSDNPVTEAKVALGRQLYFEKRLSKNHDLSCNSCHDLAHYGVDVREKGAKTSSGHKGAMGERNSPTVYNAALHLAQFWDGRAKDVEEQAKGPVLNPVEMAMADAAAVEKVLRSIPDYRPMFKAAFPEDKRPITYDNMAKAIGAFERTLITRAPIDDFLEGDMKALTDTQQQGLSLFIGSGCVACHVGSNFGGMMYQKLGLLKPYPTKDEGRFQVTHAEADKYFFKVPSLRNVAKTAPYLHDGSLDSLEAVVTVMAEHQTPKGKLTDEELSQLVAFLSSLTGKLPTEAIQEPKALAAGRRTPKPDPS